MASHFASEFARIFSTTGCSTEGYDWNKPRYFDPENECYKKEIALMESITSEAIGKYGFEVQYYVKQISTQRDKLFGEDELENIVRRFKLNVYTTDVGQQQKNYELQGMTYQDILHVQCSIAHFQEASAYDWFGNIVDAYKNYYPKIGDIMYFPWNKTYYEIINVKTFAEGSSFLSAPITFDFILRVWRNKHEDVDVMNQNTDTMDDIRQFTSLAETFNMDFMTSDVRADLPNIENGNLFSVSGDVLSINNFMNESTDKDS